VTEGDHRSHHQGPHRGGRRRGQVVEREGSGSLAIRDGLREHRLVHALQAGRLTARHRHHPRQADEDEHGGVRTDPGDEGRQAHERRADDEQPSTPDPVAPQCDDEREEQGSGERRREDEPDDRRRQVQGGEIEAEHDRIHAEGEAPEELRGEQSPAVTVEGGEEALHGRQR